MPRPKGSKNKTSHVNVIAVENIDEKIAAAEAEIARLGEELKSRKAELKELLKIQEAQLKAAAEKKAQEDREAVLAAIEASGKSVEEILEMLK